MNLDLGRKTDLALSALHALSDAGRRLTREELASHIDTTVTFLPQVMAPLVRAGWARSQRGPGGGYEITASARDAKVLEVVEAVDGPAADGRCILRNAPCPGSEECPFHTVWVEARRVLTESFAGTPVLGRNP